MMLVYSFFFNLLVSQFCGVYASIALDIKGHARLARGEIIIETFKVWVKSKWPWGGENRWEMAENAEHMACFMPFLKGNDGKQRILRPHQAVKLSRWRRFMDSLKLDQRVDFEEGDIGLAGGAFKVKRPPTPSFWPLKPSKTLQKPWENAWQSMDIDLDMAFPELKRRRETGRVFEASRTSSRPWLIRWRRIRSSASEVIRIPRTPGPRRWRVRRTVSRRCLDKRASEAFES